ncbi:hypothetical protein BC830DRAFT_1087868 [Chytriomyces sp. MP71]|nr:hypothetical protein BC830DRAFT_1087868 [Chytriomyces sp. MP71]
MLAGLPTELLQTIAIKFLDSRSLARLTATCRCIREVVLVLGVCTFAPDPKWLNECIQRTAASRATRNVPLPVSGDETGAGYSNGDEVVANLPFTSHKLRDRISLIAATGLELLGPLGLSLRYNADDLLEPHSKFQTVSDARGILQIPLAKTPRWAQPVPEHGTEEQEPLDDERYNPSPLEREILIGGRLVCSRFVHSRLPLHASSFLPFRQPHYHYFEVTIQDFDASVSLPSWVSNRVPTLEMMVGLVSSDFINRHEYLPGNDPNGISYDSVHGMINLGSRNGEGFQFGSPFGYGDTVGVGFIPPDNVLDQKLVLPPHHSDVLYPDRRHRQGVVFFTLNGEWIGDAPARISSDPTDYSRALFPAVGILVSEGPVNFDVNLGQSRFRFHFQAAKVNPVTQKATAQSEASIMQNILTERAMVHRIKATGIQPHTFVDLRYLQSPTDILRIKETGASAFNLAPNVLPHKVDKVFQAQPKVLPGGIVEWTGKRYVDVRNVQADIPLVIPNEKACAPLPIGSYFEVTVLANGTTMGRANADELGWDGVGLNMEETGTGIIEGELGFVSIGLAMRPFSPFYHVGWDFGSVAYHSDDGRLFDGAGQGGFNWSTPFTVGDVVGVGLNSAGDVYFTKNGDICGPVTSYNDDGKGVVACVPMRSYGWRLHPTIGACLKWRLQVNFGEKEFIYIHR